MTLLWIGWVLVYLRELSAARAAFEQALELARELRNEWLIADLLRSLGATISRTDPYAAQPFMEASLALWRKVGDPWGLAWVLLSFGSLAGQLGNYEQAVRFLYEGANWCRKSRDKGTLAGTLQRLSIVLLAQGKAEQAVEHLLESLELAIEVASFETVGSALVGLGGVALSRGQARRAARLLAAGERVLNTHGLSIAVWPDLLATYDRYVAALRSQLGEAAFNISSAEGGAMTLEQATEDTLVLKAVTPRQPTSVVQAEELAEPLNDRESQILKLIAQGLSNREIAEQLMIGVGTVKWHINNLFGKLGVHSRTLALARAKDLGLI